MPAFWPFWSASRFPPPCSSTSAGRAEPAGLDRLAANPLFEIATMANSTSRPRYRPVRVRPRRNPNVAELIDEIELGAAKIEALTGRRPRFLRSGTAITTRWRCRWPQLSGSRWLALRSWDKGATYSKDEVKAALLSARPGDIVILHMNHPSQAPLPG